MERSIYDSIYSANVKYIRNGSYMQENSQDMKTNQDAVQIDRSKLTNMLNQGNTAEIYSYDDKILKLFRNQMPYAPIRSEYDIALILQTKLQNVPKVYELVNCEGRYGIVYERIDGEDFLKVLIRKVGKFKSHAEMLGQIHAKLHEKDIDIHYSVKDKLKNNIMEEEYLTKEEKENIIKYLEKLPEGNKICHFDFHPGNVMIQNDEPVVIDWMTACTGNACADVARTRLLLQYGEMMHASFFTKMIIGIFEKKIGRIYYREYKRITNISDEQVEQWILPVAAARLTEWLTDHERMKLIKLVRQKLNEIERLKKVNS